MEVGTETERHRNRGRNGGRTTQNDTQVEVGTERHTDLCVLLPPEVGTECVVLPPFLPLFLPVLPTSVSSFCRRTLPTSVSSFCTSVSSFCRLRSAERHTDMGAETEEEPEAERHTGMGQQETKRRRSGAPLLWSGYD